MRLSKDLLKKMGAKELAEEQTELVFSIWEKQYHFRCDDDDPWWWFWIDDGLKHCVSDLEDCFGAIWEEAENLTKKSLPVPIFRDSNHQSCAVVASGAWMGGS